MHPSYTHLTLFYVSLEYLITFMNLLKLVFIIQTLTFFVVHNGSHQK